MNYNIKKPANVNQFAGFCFLIYSTVSPLTHSEPE
jgi:hypothetical protein